MISTVKSLLIILDYERKDRPPRCRYYALEYKNRIYHVFNAYYYVKNVLNGSQWEE